MPRVKREDAAPSMTYGERTIVTNGRKLRADANKSAAIHSDGMANVFTAMGTNLDRTRHTRFAPNNVLGWETLEAMYRGDGLVRKIIDKQVEQMTYRGYEIEGDTDGTLFSLMDGKGLNRAVKEALRWAMLYGGALGGVLVNDGSSDLSKPLNMKRIQRVDSSSVWNRWRTWWSITDAYKDPMDPKYMTPSKYKVIPILGKPFDIHESRTFRIDGLPVTDRVRVQNLGWGDSVIQAVWEQLRQMATVYNGTERIIDNFIQEVIKLKNLAQLLQTSEGEEAVKKRMEILDLSASNYRMRMLDGELEEYHKEASAVTGLADLLACYRDMVSAVTNIPQSVLFGKGEAGLQNNGDNQVRAWYDILAAHQQEKIAPALTYFLNLILLSEEYHGPLKGKLNPRIIFKPLWQLDETEDAARRLNMAKADQLYYNMGKTGESILADRFGKGHYSMESTFDPNTDFESTADRNPALNADIVEEDTETGKKGAKKKPKTKNKGENK